MHEGSLGQAARAADEPGSMVPFAQLVADKLVVTATWWAIAPVCQCLAYTHREGMDLGVAHGSNLKNLLIVTLCSYANHKLTGTEQPYTYIGFHTRPSEGVYGPFKHTHLLSSQPPKAAEPDHPKLQQVASGAG